MKAIHQSHAQSQRTRTRPNGEGDCEGYPEGEKIHLVWDNLNTHKEKPLLEFFGVDEGRQIWDKVETHYTPEHGRWFN